MKGLELEVRIVLGFVLIQVLEVKHLFLLSWRHFAPCHPPFCSLFAAYFETTLDKPVIIIKWRIWI